MKKGNFLKFYVLAGLIFVGLLFYWVIGNTPKPTLKTLQSVSEAGSRVSYTEFEVERQEIQSFDELIGLSIWLKKGISQGAFLARDNLVAVVDGPEAYCGEVQKFISTVIAPEYTLDDIAWLKLYPPKKYGQTGSIEPQFISFDGASCRLPDQFALPPPQSDWLFYGNSPHGYVWPSVENGNSQTEQRAMTLLFTWAGAGDLDYDTFDFQKACEVVVAYSPYWIGRNLERGHSVIFDMAITKVVEGVAPDQLLNAHKKIVASQNGCEPIAEAVE